MSVQASIRSAPVPVLINDSKRGWGFPSPVELWRQRELLTALATRELRVRYKQTALGAAWAILQPFMMMVVYTIFFSRLVKIPIGDIPYPVFIYSALTLWTYFANTLTRMGSGLLEYGQIITKVYFARIIIPLASLLAGLVDLAIAALVLIILMVFYRIPPSPHIWLAPLFVLLTLATAFAFGLWLAALNVEYRDVMQVIPFLMQTWFLATPIFYPAILVRPSLRFVYGLNPMVGAIDGFRWAVLGIGTPPSSDIWYSVAIVVAVLLSGLAVFRRAETNFADVI